jgi:predicted MFS family arabinose efflux permease
MLPVLGLSVLSVWLITVTFQLLLVDIAHTFHVQVGTASMVAAVGAISGAVFGLLMAVLSVRYNHKLFLLLGLGCTCLAAVAFYFAPNFTFVLIPNVAVGAGIAMVTAMAYSLIGDFYTLKQRGRAIGVIVASTTLAYVVGGPAIGVIAGFGGWRSVMTLLALPFALACLVLAVFFIPNNSKPHLDESHEPFLAGCKLAFTNKSTFAALAVTMFMLSESAIGYYSVSFFREQFTMSIGLGAVFILVGNIAAAIGGFAAGLVVNRVGRKRLGTFSVLLAAVFTLSFTFVPNLELSWGLSILRFWFSAMAFTAGGSLVIEQLPKFRSTMMSLNTTFMNLGMLLASLVGGIVLNLYSYQVMGIVLGALGVVGAVVWIGLVKEPCKD